MEHHNTSKSQWPINKNINFNIKNNKLHTKNNIKVSKFLLLKHIYVWYESGNQTERERERELHGKDCMSEEEEEDGEDKSSSIILCCSCEMMMWCSI